MEEVSLNNNIIAVIVTGNNRDKVGGGGAPIFYTEDREEMEYISMLLARITLGMVHDLGNGVKIIIKH